MSNTITVNPWWTADRINQAIAAGNVVEFNGGTYNLSIQDWYGLKIRKGVTLKAANPNDRPQIIVNNGANASALDVRAPNGVVKIENLMFWHSGDLFNNVVKCKSFEMTGCDPVPADPANGRARENFTICCGPSDSDPFSVGKMVLKGNKFSGPDNCLVIAGSDINSVDLTGNTFTGGNHVIHVERECEGGPSKVILTIEDNTIEGTVGVVIGSYKELTMKHNFIEVNGYTLDLIAIGGGICSHDAKSSAELLDNTVRFTCNAPCPSSMPGLPPGTMQFAVPFNIGSPYYDLRAYNVTMDDFKVLSPFPLGKALQTYKVTKCTIRNTDRMGYQLMSTQYDFTGEALLAAYFGNNYLFPIGQVNAADYSCLETISLKIIDNGKPVDAKLFEWPAAGNVIMVKATAP